MFTCPKQLGAPREAARGKCSPHSCGGQGSREGAPAAALDQRVTVSLFPHRGGWGRARTRRGVGREGPLCVSRRRPRCLGNSAGRCRATSAPPAPLHFPPTPAPVTILPSSLLLSPYSAPLFFLPLLPFPLFSPPLPRPPVPSTLYSSHRFLFHKMATARDTCGHVACRPLGFGTVCLAPTSGRLHAEDRGQIRPEKSHHISKPGN